MIFQLECKESVEYYCTETHVWVIVGVSVRINKWSWGMFGSCSQPIKADKIILCGTRDFQHLMRTAATKRWRLTICTHVQLANCEFPLHGIRNSRFSTFNQNSSNKVMTTYDLHSCPACELLANCGFALQGEWNSRFSTFNQNSSNKETLTTRQSPLVSAVRVNCLRTANLLFVEVTHLDNQNQNKLMH